MTPSRSADVSAVRIDTADLRAWCGDRPLQLMPRTFAVLRHLVEHAGRLITKEELLGRVWRDAIVSDAALTTCIHDLRKALGDSSDAPRYIQTVHRRGFRFIGPVAGIATMPAAPSNAPAGTSPGGAAHAGAVGVVAREPPAGATSPIRIAADASSATPRLRWDPDGSLAPSTLVGRDAELARLHELLGAALDGRRQLVFVTGEPGIGKTALVEAFLARIGSTERLRIARGQCVEHFGAGETYLPLLEALGRLGRAPRGDEVVRVLKQHAPTWLVQLSSLLDDQDLEAAQRRAQSATRERMLRELVDGLEALTAESPLVLVLEDLHWSDVSTIDLLAMLARRREPSRLLVVGTYRAADVAATRHPLKSAKEELALHARCEEIALEFLTEPAVSEYLSRRLAQDQWPAELPGALHRRTDGNPLFLVNTVDDLIARGQLRQVDGHWTLAVPLEELETTAPETLWQIVQEQIERLTPDEQAMLEIASVAGAEFSAAIATADGIDLQETERRCDTLARRGQFLRAIGVSEWPDGTVAGRYAFIHSLYQSVLYDRIPVGHRAGLHLRTGERLEKGYGQRAAEIAGELAMHFSQGRDVARAVRYHQQAGRSALRQHGYREAADHLTRALDFLTTLPPSQQRTRQELMLHEPTLHAMLGGAYAALTGQAGREVERACARALELCHQVDDPPLVFPILPALGWFYVVRGSQDVARDVGERLVAMAEATRDPAIFLAAHHTLGVAAFYSGEFEAALGHLERGAKLYDAQAHSPTRSPAFRPNVDPGMSCRLHGAWTLWVLGYPARAAEWLQAAIELASSIDHPFSLAHAHRFAAAFHQSRSERDRSQEQAERGAALAADHGFVGIVVSANFHRGWIMAEQGREEEGLACMRAWITACQRIRSESLLPGYRAWLAETYGRIGRAREGLDLVDEALAAAADSGNHYWTADLHRVRGALAESEKEAEPSLVEAIAVARQQRAKSFELRGATSLARLWARQGRAREAHALLAEVYAWFTEGFDTPDLTDARALLEQIT